jgi:starch-binding outer membrane protein, SusD/RagB family
MKKTNFIKYGIYLGVLTFSVGCTDLDEKIIDATETSKADPDVILNTAYIGLREFQAQDQIYALQEVSTDITIVPTRAGDWGDGGAWLQDHKHTWNADSREVNNAWKSLLSSVYNCDLALGIQGIAPEKKAQALFLKAFYYYNAVDFYGQVPYREAGSSPDAFPKVWDSPTATAKIIAMLDEALINLPDKVSGDPSVANKDAARFLLAKIYLNKAVFDSPTHTGFNANNSANMTKVIQYVDAISTSTVLAPDYWDNFKPLNNTSQELIFTSKNINGVSMGAIRTRWYMGAHYNSTPSGWNGFSILTDFYNTFDINDRRIKNSDPAIISAFGNPLGMQIGQQYAPAGSYNEIKVDALGNFLIDSNGKFDLVKDAAGKTVPKNYTAGVYPLSTRATNGSLPLIFNSSNLPADGVIVNNSDLERWGIRPQKYIPDTSNLDKPENDYVLMRYADALLMKAEAIARGGAGSLGSIQTSLQGRSGISTTLDLSTLAGIYKARGNELWLEGWRRNDMIRFGTFTTPRPTMSNTDAYRVLMPIPTTALLNPNIKQNPGY